MSCVMSKVLAVIMAGGQGERLSLLSQKRAKPAVPFIPGNSAQHPPLYFFRRVPQSKAENSLPL